MKIVIDIPEMTLLNITSRELLLCSREDIEKLEFAIKNGTPLPKGHGRLIDADKLWDSYHDLDYDFYEALDLVDTIIEEDTESEAKK